MAFAFFQLGTRHNTGVPAGGFFLRVDGKLPNLQDSSHDTKNPIY